MSEFVEAALDFLLDAVLPFVGFLLVVAVIIAGLLFAIRGFGHHIDERTCSAFSIQTGREAKFVDYSWLSWDCLTPASDGKWVSTDALREVVR